MHAGQTFQFSKSFFFRFFRQIFLFDFFAVFIRLYRIFICFAQLLLDGLHLLAQIIIPLAFVDVVPDFGLNFIAQFQNFHLVINQASQSFETLLHIGNIQHFLFFFHRRVDD